MLELEEKHPKIHIGIFGSIQYTMPIQDPVIHKEFCEQIRTSFRILNLSKPDLIYVFRSMLFVEKYSLPDETTIMLVKYLEIFERMKNEKLYNGEKPDDVITEELSLANMRQAMKIATILKNQEINAFRKEQIERDAFEFRIKDTVDKFEVESFYNELAKCWQVRQKSREDYLKERDRWTVIKDEVNKVKYQAEIDGLKEGMRLIIKNRVMREWRAAKFKKYNQAIKNEEETNPFDIDTKQIEYEVDKTIIEAFKETVAFMQENVGTLKI